MSVARMTQYTCDNCERMVIAENKPPAGWIRLSSTTGRSVGTSGTPINSPVLVRPMGGVEFLVTSSDIWCSPDCLTAWLHRALSTRMPT